MYNFWNVFDGARRVFDQLRHDRRGSIAIKFALILPALALISLGGVDLHAVYSASRKMQDIADGAALAGGRELALAVNDTGPVNRAEAFVEGHVADWGAAPDIETEVSVIQQDGQRALKVVMAGRRASFFGNLLPPGGWRMNAQAVASPVALAPLCVLTHGQSVTDALWLRNRSAIDAPACLIHSNRKVKAADRSHILAATTQSVGAATGNIQAAPQTGAPPIPDPYLNLTPTPPGGCPLLRKVVQYKASATLNAGVHCDDIVVSGTATLTLAPGEHYFVRNRLLLHEDARLNGTDVVMVFDRAAFDFIDRSRVNLAGRQSGRYAGFVLIGLRPPMGVFCPSGPPSEDDDDDDDGGGGLISGVGHIVGGLVGTLVALLDSVRPDNCLLGSEFRMASDNVESLDGVIYFPVAKLVVEGAGDIAESSDWTVMVVEALEVRGSPNLVINADYAGAAVPVPQGVGPQTGAVNLIQ